MKGKKRMGALLAVAVAAASAALPGTEALASYVTAEGGLNVREQPDTSSEAVGFLNYGDEVDVMEYDGEWDRLLSEDGIAYVKSEYVSEEDPLDGMEFLGTWLITAYGATGSPCASGAWPEVGRTVACNSLPFGTRVWIDGVGERVVEDRGPSSLGSEWLDLYLGDEGACWQWGAPRLNVYLIK